MPVSSTADLTRQGIALRALCGLLASAWAAGAYPAPPASGIEIAAAANAPRQSLDFSIPAQALAAALNQYGALTDQPAVFVSDMVVGRRSSTVQGAYSPEDGLRILLQGTGLSFEKISSELGTTFLLRETARPAAPATLAAFYGLAGYPGLIQERIQEVLCAEPLTAPGQYGSVFRFRLDGNGRVHHATLLDSTGNARRDAALLGALQRVSIGLPPPPMVVEEPLTMRLRPADPHAAPQCRPSRELRP